MSIVFSQKSSHLSFYEEEKEWESNRLKSLGIPLGLLCLTWKNLIKSRYEKIAPTHVIHQQGGKCH